MVCQGRLRSGRARRQPLRRLGVSSVGLVLIGLLLTLGVGAHSASADTLGQGVIASYSGTWTAHRAGGGLTDDLTLTWAETYPVPAGETGEEPYWALTSAHGNVSQTGEAGLENYDCNATLSINPAAATTPSGNGAWGAGIVTENIVDPAYSWPNYWTVWDLQPPVSYYYPTDPLLSSDSGGNQATEGVCVDEEYFSTLAEGHYGPELTGVDCHFDTNPEVEFDWISFPVGTSNETEDNCEATGHEGEVSWKAMLKSKINFYSPGSPSSGTGPSPPPPPPLPSQKQQAAQIALEDLRDTAIPNLERYCGPAVAGLLGVGAGVASGNAYLTVAGGLTASAMNPFCGAALTRAVNDYKIHNDPPLASIDVIARPAATSTVKLRSCKRYHGQLGRFCERLRSAYTKLVDAAQKVASITAAIEETVSRERSAYEQGNEAAMNAQNTHLITLLGERTAAEAGEAKAGKAAAMVLRGAQISFKLSKGQSAKAIALAKGELGKQGVGVSELGSVDSSALTPKAANLLANLEHL
jgi:hypothetical protein